MQTACWRTYGLSAWQCSPTTSLRLDRSLKHAFNEHSARGGGKQKATGQSACGRPKASVNLDADALGQVLQWVFLYFHIHRHQHDVVRRVPCVPRAYLESIPHSPTPFLSSLLSSAPQHGRAHQQRYAGHVGRHVEGNTKHAGSCVPCHCVHACERVHDLCIVACHVRIMCVSFVHHRMPWVHHAMAASGLCWSLGARVSGVGGR